MLFFLLHDALLNSSRFLLFSCPALIMTSNRLEIFFMSILDLFSVPLSIIFDRCHLFLLNLAMDASIVKRQDYSSKQ